jgi:hypothetical protein
MGKLFLDYTHVPSDNGSGYYVGGFAVNLITQYQFSPKWKNELFKDSVYRKVLYCVLHISVVFRGMKYKKYR